MINAIHEKLQSYIDDRHIAGASLIVYNGNEIVHEEYAGHADIAADIPIKPDTLFRLASMTKPIIAVAIMHLADKGLLSITDPIAKYIPEFAEMKVSAEFLSFGPDVDMDALTARAKAMKFVPLKRPIVIEDLLRHRSGLGQGIVSAVHGVNNAFPGMTLAQRISNIANCPMDFQPGENSGYSATTAFDVLGRIVEIVTGKELESWLKENIFDPLGMTDATFFPSPDQKVRIPRMYQRTGDVLEDMYPDDNTANVLSFSFPCGSGGMYATISDYDHFVRMLANGGAYNGHTILRPETVRAMASRSDTDPVNFTWGLGMNVFSCYEKSGRWLAEGAFGWSGAFGTHFYIDPVNDVSMVLMVNRADIGGASSYVSWGMEEAIFKGLDLKSWNS